MSEAELKKRNGIIIGIICVFLGSLLATQMSNPSNQQESYTDCKYKAENIHTNALNEVINGVESGILSEHQINQARKESNQQHLENIVLCNDLDAQQAMSGRTHWGLFIGFWGLIAIIATLWQTQKAAGATSSALEVAEKTLADNRDSIERQLRAYLIVEDITLVNSEAEDGDVDPPQFRVLIRNTGQTPATNIRQMVAFGARTRGEKTTMRFTDREGNAPILPKFIVGAGMDHPIAVGMRSGVTNDEARAMWQLDVNVFGGGFLSYDDAFGKRRRTLFKFHLGYTPNQGYVTIPDAKNNRIS